MNPFEGIPSAPVAALLAGGWSVHMSKRHIVAVPFLVGVHDPSGISRYYADQVCWNVLDSLDAEAEKGVQ